MKKFNNQVVWITGASSGIGEATAYAFAKAGAKLVLSARRIEELNRVKNNIDETDVLVLPMDMENLADLPSKVEEVLARFGRIDILFNNAGISQRSSVEETEMEVYHKIMNLNFFGVVALTKAVLPQMRNQKSGVIVTTSSLSGKLSTPMRSGYCASKHALHGFFDALRAEVYRDNIQITLICPGYIQTNISYNAVSGDGTKFGKLDNNQANGMAVETCAEKILDAVYRQKEEVYMGGKEVLGVYLKRFFPRLLSKIVRKQMPK